jgi:hypothetical protein
MCRPPFFNTSFTSQWRVCVFNCPFYMTDSRALFAGDQINVPNGVSL